MVKSRAEIMRDYRKRMKEDPEKYHEYLAQARSRKRKNYVPAEKLTKKERVKRSEMNKEYLCRHRQKKQNERELEKARRELTQPTPESSGYDTGRSESTQLVVNFPFPNRRNGPRKRISNTLAKKQKELNKLKTENESMRLKYQRTLRKLQRYKKANAKSADKSECLQQKGSEISEKNPITENLTPNSKTKRMMSNARLSQEQRSKVHKQFLFSFAVQNQMRTEKRGIKPTEKGSLRTHISAIFKKYGLKKSVSKHTGLSRNCLKGLSKCEITRRRETRKHKKKVTDFLSRDDNSRSNPGKRDKVKTHIGNEQTRTLTDYLRNLHQKFLSENPSVKLSLASFCRLRPRYIKLSAFITRSSCLCTRHQNMALTARALRGCGLNVPINPEEFVKDDKVNEVLENDIPDTIKVGQWKRVPVEDKGRKKMIMKKVESELKREDFLKFIRNQMLEFIDHVFRVKRQYDETGQLKAHLKATDAILHMDFAENYTCKSVEEIQTAYWNKTGVTLHPIVVYYKGVDGSLAHKSIVMVSDEQGHSSSTVLTFLDKAIPQVKKLVNGLERIHYWTDSPTSQYRNKTIFDAVDRHEELFGGKATWNYFESGHGKGLCDGLGGLTKRLADEAVNMGKVTIQDALEFYSWTQSMNCTMKNVDFIFVSSDECAKKVEEIGRVLVKPIPGTMKFHAIVGGIEKRNIYVANVSCYCSNCIIGEMCEHWKKETVIRSDRKTDEPAVNVPVPDQGDEEHDRIKQTHQQAELDEETNEPKAKKSKRNDNSTKAIEPIESARYEIATNIEYTEGDFVAAVYSNMWYVGEIIDKDEGELEINFMTLNKYMTFKWPANEDKIWLNHDDILTKIGKPMATGRSQRAYKLEEQDLKLIQTLFDARKGSFNI